MSFKSIFLSCSLVLASAASFAGSELIPVEILKPCTLEASFTSGDTTVSVSVTASTCGAAAATLGVIADALDAE